MQDRRLCYQMEWKAHLVCRLHIYQCMLKRCASLLEHLAMVPSNSPLVNVQALIRHAFFSLESGAVDD